MALLGSRGRVIARVIRDLPLGEISRRDESMEVVEAAQKEPGFSDSSAPKIDLKFLLPAASALSLIYALFIAGGMQRGLWYDELFTLDIASASTSGRVLELIHKWDLNPPLSYFLSRWSMQIFGHGKLGVRLPSIIEFYAASVFLFAFASKRIGNIFASFAVLILWEGPLFYYAVEARPYALLLMLFSMLLFCWDRAISPNRPSWSLAGTFFATLGMLLSHVFAPLSLSAIFVAEAVRFGRTRKTDFSLWLALLLPCLAMFTYIPLFRIYRPVIFPYIDQASFVQIRLFFQQAVWDSTAVVYATMLALAFSWNHLERGRVVQIPRELSAVAFALLCTPIILNLVLMPGHRAFWPRYCITASAAICVTYAFLLAYRSRVGRVGGCLAAVVLLAFGLRNTMYAIRHGVQAGDSSMLTTIKPELPLVIENGLTFFEMNQFEDGKLLNRSYYLKDRPAAIRYSHGTLFEDFEPPDRLDPEFHIRAHVSDYGSFVAAHRHFLVLASGNGAYWLVHKLHDDGEQVEKVADANTLYRDTELYLVTVSNPAPTDEPTKR
jgi:Dolichyl-phosphate-mannose-protein mannosyltransferase